jgi:ADP-heptose:LPS heptosyltransferase
MSPRRVLFIAEGQLGDLLLLTPAIRAMKYTFPDATVSVLVLNRRGAQSPRESHEPPRGSLMTSGQDTILGTNPHVSDITVLDRRALRDLPLRRKILAELRVVLSLRSHRYDTVICTFPEDRFVLWAFLSGASVRVGQQHQAFSRLLTHRPVVQKQTRGVLEYYGDLVRAVGADMDSRATEYQIPREASEWAVAHLRSLGLERVSRLLAVHPGATGDYKIWPPECYAAVLDALDGSQGVRTLLFCGPGDVAVVEEITRRARRPPTVVKTEGNLAHFAGLLGRCSLLISNDSGPRHLAAALGVPTITPFRKFHDREWKVYADTPTCVALTPEGVCGFCPPDACLDRIPDGEQYGSYCLRMIRVEDVVASAMRILSQIPGV